MSEIKQAFGDTARITNHVANIVKSGAATADDIIDIFTNYHAAKIIIPRQV